MFFKSDSTKTSVESNSKQIENANQMQVVDSKNNVQNYDLEEDCSSAEYFKDKETLLNLIDSILANYEVNNYAIPKPCLVEYRNYVKNDTLARYHVMNLQSIFEQAMNDHPEQSPERDELFRLRSQLVDIAIGLGESMGMNYGRILSMTPVQSNKEHLEKQIKVFSQDLSEVATPMPGKK